MSDIDMLINTFVSSDIPFTLFDSFGFKCIRLKGEFDSVVLSFNKEGDYIGGLE